MAFDWKSIVRTVAPTLATALGGPLAGTAVKMIGDKLLGDPNATEEQIEAALASATPADLLALKELEQSFKLEMKKLGIREKELEYADIADARSLAEATSFAPQAWLTCIFILGYFTMLVYVLTMLSSDMSSLNPAILSLVSTLIGVVTSEIPKSMAFWFGSSKGSKDKSAAMSAAMADAVRHAQQHAARVVPAAVTAAPSAPPSASVAPSVVVPTVSAPAPAPVSTAQPSWMRQ